jgi:hypothetical protein
VTPQRIRADVPVDQLALELPGLPPLRLVDPIPRRPRRPPTAGGADSVVAAPAAAVGERERVWLVWEDEEVLGVYGDPDTAAADCATLRRHAHRDRLGVRYDWMAVPVFSGRRHQPPIAQGPGEVSRGWRPQ